MLNFHPSVFDTDTFQTHTRTKHPLHFPIQQPQHSEILTMKLSQTLMRIPFSTTPRALLHCQNSIFSSYGRRVSLLGYKSLRFQEFVCSSSSGASVSSSAVNPSSPLVASNSSFDSVVSQEMPGKLEGLEEGIEKMIYRCRFLAILGVFGSLIGSFLCFIKILNEDVIPRYLGGPRSSAVVAPDSLPNPPTGSTFVAGSFLEYSVNRTKVMQMLIEALDVYLLGTVMLVFGMGLYELFVSNLGSASSIPDQNPSDRSNLFGLFSLKERPKWLDIKTVNELKTKVGHVIVMLLLIGLFDRSKKATIQTPVDLLCFCASVFLSSSCLFLLSKLNDSN